MESFDMNNSFALSSPDRHQSMVEVDFDPRLHPDAFQQNSIFTEKFEALKKMSKDELTEYAKRILNQHTKK